MGALINKHQVQVNKCPSMISKCPLNQSQICIKKGNQINIWLTRNWRSTESKRSGVPLIHFRIYTTSRLCCRNLDINDVGSKANICRGLVCFGGYDIVQGNYITISSYYYITIYLYHYISIWLYDYIIILIPDTRIW